ncbi:MAG: hypothetical protein V1867_04210 [Candidatus Falkowbacteria bacterium]
MPGDTSEHTCIGEVFDKILLDAVVAFSDSNENYIARIRRNYEKETGSPVPNIDEFSTELWVFVHSDLGSIIREVFPQQWEMVLNGVFSLFLPHYHYLDKLFRKFVRKVWRAGMLDSVKYHGDACSGVFGDSKLSVFSIGDRYDIRFERKNCRITYRIAEEDYQDYSAGFRHCDTDPMTAAAMIEDAIKYWPRDKEFQKKSFRKDGKAVWINRRDLRTFKR